MKEEGPRHSPEQIAQQERLVKMLRSRAAISMRKDRATFFVYGADVESIAKAFGWTIPSEAMPYIRVFKGEVISKDYVDLNVQGFVFKASDLVLGAVAQASRWFLDDLDAKRKARNN